MNYINRNTLKILILFLLCRFNMPLLMLNDSYHRKNKQTTTSTMRFLKFFYFHLSFTRKKLIWTKVVLEVKLWSHMYNTKLTKQPKNKILCTILCTWLWRSIVNIHGFMEIIYLPVIWLRANTSVWVSKLIGKRKNANVHNHNFSKTAADE